MKIFLRVEIDDKTTGRESRSTVSLKCEYLFQSGLHHKDRECRRQTTGDYCTEKQPENTLTKQYIRSQHVVFIERHRTTVPKESYQWPAKKVIPVIQQKLLICSFVIYYEDDRLPFLLLSFDTFNQNTTHFRILTRNILTPFKTLRYSLRKC